MVLNKIQKLADAYIKAEGVLIKALTELKSGDGDCKCDVKVTIETIHDDEYSEVITRCLNCGGYVI